MGIVDEIKQSYRTGGALTKLIYINIAVFIVIRLLLIFPTLLGNNDPRTLLVWVSIPADLNALIWKPWTLLTYMFAHYDFIHILFNMLWLYWFGRIFLEFFNPRQLLGVYLLGGFLGAALYLIGYNLVPVLVAVKTNSILLGASGSVMAILFAVARYSPNHKIYLMFFGAVPLKYLAMGAFIIDLISIHSLNNTGGQLAHIGGAIFGYLYGTASLKGKDYTLGFNRWMDKVASLFAHKSKMTVSYKRPVSDMEYNSRKVKRQKDVDRVLDKIKESGYDSLTKEEKQILFDASK